MVYFDRFGKVTAIEEFDASSDAAACKLAEERDWSGSYEIRSGSRTVFAHVSPQQVVAR